MTFDISADDFQIEAYGTVTNPDAEAELVMRILRAAEAGWPLELSPMEVGVLADLLQ